MEGRQPEVDDVHLAGGNRLKRIRYGLVGLLLLAAGIAAHGIDLFGGAPSSPFLAVRIKTSLMKGLVNEYPLPRVQRGPSPDSSLVVYILGGGQDSLGYKFKIAARLYKEGPGKKILLLHDRGITEFSPALGRNLTNAEWAIMRLVEEGVAREDVEFATIPPSFFGTFGEARAVSALVRSRGVRRLVLVSSKHHTERVRLSFSHFNRDNAIELYTYGSEETGDLYELFTEFVKLRVYRYFLLPLEASA